LQGLVQAQALGPAPAVVPQQQEPAAVGPRLLVLAEAQQQQAQVLEVGVS
jgi:hypothetical protein